MRRSNVNNLKDKFVPGGTYIPASGKVFDQDEIKNLTKVVNDGWWTEGEFARQFEADFRKYLPINYVALTNSGSSANLLAVASLTSRVFGNKRLKAGDEFITCPVAFPTTVNPGILYGLKPVFVDIDLKTLNVDTNLIERAITKKTKLIILAHTLGKPFDLNKIVKIAKKYNLWLIEDACDALGSTYREKHIGTFGDISTFSFYPAHQITMAEGGAIVTNNPQIYRAVCQFRDWGRDCWCNTGEDDTCGKRFGWKLGNLPLGYDHKFIYSQIGYNLKLTDFQAAIGVAQLKKLPNFINIRRDNYQKLYDFFSQYKKYFMLIKKGLYDNPSWFGFPIIIRQGSPFTRNELTEFLESKQIGSRNVFSGNLLKHPAYEKIKYRIINKIVNADLIMNNAFWIGVYPGINEIRLNYIKKVVSEFLNNY